MSPREPRKNPPATVTRLPKIIPGFVREKKFLISMFHHIIVHIIHNP